LLSDPSKNLASIYAATDEFNGSIRTSILVDEIGLPHNLAFFVPVGFTVPNKIKRFMRDNGFVIAYIPCI
jgi:glycopeptide antibiotics resistance protein